MNTLTTISPIDGRYRNKVENLANYFSEFALIKYRVMVEIEYFIELTQLNIQALADFPQDKKEDLRAIYQNFTEKDASHIKEIEKITNHDVKAVEYF